MIRVSLSDDVAIIHQNVGFFDGSLMLQRIIKGAAVLVIHFAILLPLLHAPRLGKVVDRVSFVQIRDTYKTLRPEPTMPRMLQPIFPSDVPPDLNLLDDNLATLPPRLDPQFENGSPSIPIKFAQRNSNIGKFIVLMHIHVLKSGLVDQAAVTGSCGLPELDEVALQFVKDHWRFLPAEKEGFPIDSWGNTEVLFRSTEG